MRLLRARGSAKLGKVASDSARQDLWLRNRKVGYQVVVEDRSRLPGGETVGEDEPATKRRRECTYLGLDLGEREEHVACHASALALATTDEA